MYITVMGITIMVMYRKSNSLYMMRFLCIDTIHYPPLIKNPPFIMVWLVVCSIYGIHMYMTIVIR